jgi:hypothetical protein
VPRRFEYAVTETLGEPAKAEPDWSPEHLVLAGLARCTLKSLDFHAQRATIAVRGTAAADGLDVELDPLPDDDRLGDLLDLAERDCFVGASLSVRPRYEWRVNGRLVR